MTVPLQPIRLLALLPLSHVFGQFTGLYVPIALGGSVVFMQEIHPSAILETIRRGEVLARLKAPERPASAHGVRALLAEQLPRRPVDAGRRHRFQQGVGLVD